MPAGMTCSPRGEVQGGERASPISRRPVCSTNFRLPAPVGGFLSNGPFEHGPADYRSHRHCRGCLCSGGRRARINPAASTGHCRLHPGRGTAGPQRSRSHQPHRRPYHACRTGRVDAAVPDRDGAQHSGLCYGPPHGPVVRLAADRHRARAHVPARPAHELAGQDRGAARLHRIAEQHRRGGQDARGHR